MNNNNEVEMTSVVTHSHNSLDSCTPKLRSASVDHTTSHIKPILRQSRTHSSLRNIPGITPIKENISEENKKQPEKMLTLSVPNLYRNSCAASVNANKSTVRGSSRSQKSLNGNHAHAYLENTFDGDAMSYEMKYSSNQSLSTIKEQYCCTPQCSFTPRERKLCAAVGVLATIIVILVIAVGILAGHTGGENTFHWSF